MKLSSQFNYAAPCVPQEIKSPIYVGNSQAYQHESKEDSKYFH